MLKRLEQRSKASPQPVDPYFTQRIKVRVGDLRGILCHGHPVQQQKDYSLFGESMWGRMTKFIDLKMVESMKCTLKWFYNWLMKNPSHMLRIYYCCEYFYYCLNSVKI